LGDPLPGSSLDPDTDRRRLRYEQQPGQQGRSARCFENASQGDFAALHQFVSPDYVLHPEEIRGIDGLAAMVEGYRSALAGLQVTVEHQFTEGEYVATRSTIRGRHEGGT